MNVFEFLMLSQWDDLDRNCSCLLSPITGQKYILVLNIRGFHEGKKFSASAYYVLRGVKAEGELFVYYGSGYEKHRKKAGYTQPYRFTKLGMKENPQSVLETIPSNCFAEADS